MTVEEIREALAQLRLDEAAHPSSEEYWLLPSALDAVLEAARAYADLLEKGQTFQWHQPMVLHVPGQPHLSTTLEPGRYLVVPVEEDA